MGRPFLGTTLEERFHARVDINGPIPAHRPSLGNCHLWTGSKNGDGYGILRIDGRYLPATHVALKLAGITVPPRHNVDHLCRNPPCVCAEHLEPVTQRINMLRGESPSAVLARGNTCSHGHAYTPANTYIEQPSGKRRCRTCRNAAERRYNARRRAK